MKTAFLDCFSGISGDMFVGALLDAGLEFESLKAALSGLPLEGVEVKAVREGRHGIFGTRFVVDIREGGHPHRSFEDIRGIIGESGLDDRVKHRSLAVFQALAEAEGKIHNQPPDRVHFHEVGAADSIVDIVGGVFGVHSLKIDRIHASALPLGSGFTDTQHGPIPLPAPAALNLLHGVPVYDSGLMKELVTPTGAALVKVLSTSFGPMPSFTLERTGYGVGARDLPDRPNLLRLLVGVEHGESLSDTVVVLESNLDDCPPEMTGYLSERLLEAGALDVLLLPAHMKKNRPGVLIQVLGRPEHKGILEQIILTESTTLGVRSRIASRRVLERSLLQVESPWGPMTVKAAVGLDGRRRVFPEYESCRKIARENGIPLGDVYAWVQARNQGGNRRGYPP